MSTLYSKIIMHPLKMSLRPYKLFQRGNLVMHSFIFYFVELGCTFRNNERAFQIYESPKSVTIKNCSFIGNEAMYSGKDLCIPNICVVLGNQVSE